VHGGPGAPRADSKSIPPTLSGDHNQTSCRSVDEANSTLFFARNKKKETCTSSTRFSGGYGGWRGGWGLQKYTPHMASRPPHDPFVWCVPGSAQAEENDWQTTALESAVDGRGDLSDFLTPKHGTPPFPRRAPCGTEGVAGVHDTRQPTGEERHLRPRLHFRGLQAADGGHHGSLSSCGVYRRS